MASKKPSPKIDTITWGKLTTGNATTYKDAKLFPGGSRKWDWNETGTHHKPGIQPADVEELLEHGTEKVVLSQGFHERLQVCQETKDMLKEKNIDFFIMETGDAVDKYNQLRESTAVGALIHSTC